MDDKKAFLVAQGDALVIWEGEEGGREQMKWDRRDRKGRCVQETFQPAAFYFHNKLSSSELLSSNFGGFGVKIDSG